MHISQQESKSITLWKIVMKVVKSNCFCYMFCFSSLTGRHNLSADWLARPLILLNHRLTQIFTNYGSRDICLGAALYHEWTRIHTNNAPCSDVIYHTAVPTNLLNFIVYIYYLASYNHFFARCILKKSFSV